MYLEGLEYLNTPDFVPMDMFMIMRQAIATYNLLFYIDADQRREEDCYWSPKHGSISAQVVRSMIDCLYNVTAILEDPARVGPLYKQGGLRKRLKAIREDEARR